MKIISGSGDKNRVQNENIQRIIEYVQVDYLMKLSEYINVSAIS